jgi:BirA family biotin operon repressor/biotin-[acetyl-CoA-carboxylase] ligase
MAALEEAVLYALKAKPGEFVSGEELSHLSGVSRTAVWKEIGKLRAEGYKISARPHQGYRLTAVPDRLTAQELRWNLKTRLVGNRIHAYESTDSTMDLSHRLAASGEPEGSVVITESQNKGRGRMGRAWSSPRGTGLYFSVLLRPTLPVSRVPHVTLVAAVAVADAVKATTGLQADLKWPNDLLIDGKKICGILTELNAEINRVNYLVLGVGMNLNTPKSALPAHATSLKEKLGEKVDRLTLARALFQQLDRRYHQFLNGEWEPILEAWRSHARFLGSRVRVALEGRVIDGQALDIDSDGALLVRADTGIVESVSAGEVLLVR